MESTKGEDYIQKAKTIYTLLNQFRQNPRLLAKKLEMVRTYLDTSTNVLSEPNKIQIQMVEGDSVFKEAIAYLKKLPAQDPLEWDENLAKSAMAHVNDIGPKGLLIYQSSDGTDPQDRISKYGVFNESLGENIDFGPNDALGVIISLMLDDGEEQRPHRENLFKGEYYKVGIACGTHASEFQMCVMDFAYDFSPLDNDEGEAEKGMMNSDPIVNISLNEEDDKKDSSKAGGGKVIAMLKGDMINNSNMGIGSSHIDNYNESPLVKLSLGNDEFIKEKHKSYNTSQCHTNTDTNNVINNMTSQVNTVFPSLKLKCKKVEKITKITYYYENGSTSEVIQTQQHTFSP